MIAPGLPKQKSIGWAQIRNVFDNMPIRIALVDRNHRYRFANQENGKLIGKPADTMRGRTVAQVFGKEMFARIRPMAERALAGETVDWVGWLDHRFGRRYLRCTFVPLRDAAGTVEGYFGFVRDLTDLRHTEQDLAKQLAARTASEALNAAIISAATDCIITIDEAGRVVEFNPAAEQTFGYSRTDVLGQPIVTLIVPHIDQRADLSRDLDEVPEPRRLVQYRLQRGAELGRCLASGERALKPQAERRGGSSTRLMIAMPHRRRAGSRTLAQRN
jgi:two-component system NtrC family sensor kinase